MKNHPVWRAIIVVLSFLIVCVLSFGIYVALYEPNPTVDPVEKGEEEYNLKEDQYNFLLLGLDHSGYLADVVMIAQFDTEHSTISLMQLPRDTYLETEEGVSKLNAAFSHFRRKAEAQGEERASLVAARSLANDLEKTFCIRLPYLFLVSLDAFVDVFDILLPEGLVFTIPWDMDYDDPYQDLSIHFKKGETVLHGKEAEAFARFRSGYVEADVGRMDAQKLLLSAALPAVKNALASLNLSSGANLVKTALENLETNLSVLDAVYFTRALAKVDMSMVYLMTLPGEALKNTQGIWYYQANRDDTRVAINEYFNLFSSEVTDYMFDEYYALVDEKDSTQLKVYLDESGKYVSVYRVSDINESSIEIKTKK